MRAYWPNVDSGGTGTDPYRSRFQIRGELHSTLLFFPHSSYFLLPPLLLTVWLHRAPSVSGRLRPWRFSLGFPFRQLVFLHTPILAKIPIQRLVEKVGPRWKSNARLEAEDEGIPSTTIREISLLTELQQVRCVEAFIPPGTAILDRVPPQTLTIGRFEKIFGHALTVNFGEFSELRVTR